MEIDCQEYKSDLNLNKSNNRNSIVYLDRYVMTSKSSHIIRICLFIWLHLGSIGTNGD